VTVRIKFDGSKPKTKKHNIKDTSLHLNIGSNPDHAIWAGEK